MKEELEKFPGGLVGLGSCGAAAMSLVTTVMCIWALAQELLHAVGVSKKKKKSQGSDSINWWIEHIWIKDFLDKISA